MIESGSQAPLRQLVELGQSPWLDFTTRAFIRSGMLDQLIANEGVRGLSTNPTLFEVAIARGSDYDADIIALAEAGFTPEEITEKLMVSEVREACDCFEALYGATHGADGLVSLEVNPELAHDADGTVEAARRLWAAIGRSNVMIKIPATREGLIAIERCLALGINVNATLIFSVTRYRAVLDAYAGALAERRVAGLPLDRIASVASVFVRRVDSLVDRKLEAEGSAEARALLGKAGIANATLAYAAFQRAMATPAWRAFVNDGARPQRPLWAATQVKDPITSVKYVEALIAPGSVVALRPATLDSYRESGRPERRITEQTIAEATRTIDALARVGIAMDQIAEELEADGVARFELSAATLLSAVERKAAVLTTRA